MKTPQKIGLALLVPSPLYAVWFSFWLWDYLGATQGCQWWAPPLFITLFITVAASIATYAWAASRLGELNEGMS